MTEEIPEEETTEEREQLRETLEPWMGFISRRLGRFCHELTGNIEDPLALPDPVEVAATKPPNLDDVTKRYAGSDDR